MATHSERSAPLRLARDGFHESEPGSPLFFWTEGEGVVNLYRGSGRIPEPTLLCWRF